MNYETDILTVEGERNGEAERVNPAPFMPPGTVMGERAAGWLRAYLERNGLEEYQVYCSNDLDLHDVDEHLEALGAGDGAAAWEAVEPLSPGGEQPAYLSGRRGEKAFPAGVLHLRAHRAVIGRWYWFDTDEGSWYTFRLLATPSVEHYAKLRETMRDLRRRTATAAWRVVSGEPWKDGEKLNRDEGGLDALILPEALRARLEADVVGFFSERAAGLYARLGVSYRRGVLLYGPPGNGKTSIIRALAAKLPAVSGFVLRATGSLDDDDFATVVKRWTGAAPAILVIEDLNWLFPNRVTVSTFLNLIDGLETPRAGGLMLVASTNHPETLDPALSDRPGRFDVTVEVPSPGRDLRGEFFWRALAGPDLPGEATMGKLVRETAGLSFAHLREVVQAAGLAAIRAGREARTDEDLVAAAEAVARAHRAAGHGFPVVSEEPFGLAQWRSTRVDERQEKCGFGSD